MAEDPGWPGGFALLPHPGELVFGVFSTFAGLLPLVAVGVVVFVWLRTRRPHVPTSTAQAIVAAGYDPASPPAWPVGAWNAQVTPQGSLPLFGGLGTVRVENGWLGFHPENASQPSWLVAASAVRAGKNSMLATSEVWLESGETGRLNLTVSHEHINLVMDNDFKDLRERRYADEFLFTLHQSGAQVVAG